MTVERVFLGLGSNLGDRQGWLRAALQRIAGLPDTRLVRVSSIYESTPVGLAAQGRFLNLVAEVHTSLTPEGLLTQLQAIESALGRVRETRWGPRTVDIDILYWGTRVIETTRLRVPHPEAARRRFVLQPLSEIAPGWRVPPSFRPVEALLREVGADQVVKPVPAVAAECT